MKRPTLLALIIICLAAAPLSLRAQGQNASSSAHVYGDIHAKPKPIADVDGDGVKDLVFGAADGQIHIFSSGKGKEIIRPPFWPKHTGGPIIGELQIADVDGDGEKEIMAASQDGYVYCINSKGKTKWKAKAGGMLKTGVKVEDLDNTGHTDDILICTEKGRLYNFNGAGGSIKWQTEGPDFNNAPTATGDLNADGRKEIIIKDRTGTINICEFKNGRYIVTNKLAPKNEHFLQSSWQNRVGVNDYDGDGRNEIFTTYYQNGMGKFFMWGSDRKLIASFTIEEAAYAAPLLADITGNGQNEIVIAQADGGVSVCDKHGKMKPGWPWSARSLGACIFSEPQILDIDGDKHPDIVFTVCDPKKKGTESGYVMALSAKGERLEGYPKYIGQVMAGLTFADLDGDGFLEMVAAGGMNYTGKQLYIFKTKARRHVKIAVMGQYITFK